MFDLDRQTSTKLKIIPRTNEKKKTTTHTRVKEQKIQINSKYRGRTTDLRILVHFVRKKKRKRKGRNKTRNRKISMTGPIKD